MKIKKIIIVALMIFCISGLPPGYGTCETSAGKRFPALVETQWLAGNMNKSEIKIIFVDEWPSRKADYQKKHIPGSAYLDMGTLMGTIGVGRVPPDKDNFESMMSKLGINKNDHVVLYGYEGKTIFTLGAFWLMEYFGHEKVSYLDGGLEKWSREGLKVSGESTTLKPTRYEAGAPDKSMRVDAGYVLKRLTDPQVVLVDTRSADEYNGRINREQNLRVGHIPGAVNLDSLIMNFNNDGTIKSDKDLTAIYEAKGVTRDKEIIVYCQGAMKTATTFFVLKHMLGYANVKSYLGSWGEWGNMVDFDKFPIE
ncbi:MAG TPA: sulfurtransferase [Nitrospiraceae bacterium]|nr:sulfurtransferase [Nitrospiraceae bacterium]